MYLFFFNIVFYCRFKKLTENKYTLNRSLSKECFTCMCTLKHTD